MFMSVPDYVLNSWGCGFLFPNLWLYIVSNDLQSFVPTTSFVVVNLGCHDPDHIEARLMELTHIEAQIRIMTTQINCNKRGSRDKRLKGRWKLYKATNLGKRNPFSHKFRTKCVTHGKMSYDRTTITHKVNFLIERNDDKPPTDQGECNRSAFWTICGTVVD